jgi:outer membrane protein assembly factor BamB
VRGQGTGPVQVELVEETDAGAPLADAGPDWRELLRRVPRRAWAVVACVLVLAVALHQTVAWRADREETERLARTEGLAPSLAEPLREQWRVPGSFVLGVVGDVLVLSGGSDTSARGVGVADGVVRWERESGPDASGWCWLVHQDGTDPRRFRGDVVSRTEAGEVLLACIDSSPMIAPGPFATEPTSGQVVDPHSDVTVWDPVTGELVRRVAVPGTGYPTQVGTDVAALGVDGAGRLVGSRWSLLTGATVWEYTGRPLERHERSRDMWWDERGLHFGNPPLLTLDVETGEPVVAPPADAPGEGWLDRATLPDGGTAVTSYDGAEAQVTVSDADGTRRFTATGQVLRPGVDDGTADQVLLVTSLQGGGLTALDVRTGEELWRTDVASWNLVVLAGRVVVRDDGGLTALDVRTGATVWEHEDPSPDEAGGLLTDGRVLVVVVRGDDGTELVARDAGTGEERWRVGSSLAGGSLQVLPDGRVLLSDQRETVVLTP